MGCWRNCSGQERTVSKDRRGSGARLYLVGFEEVWEADLDMVTMAVFLGVEITKDASILEMVLFRLTSPRSRTLPSEDMEPVEVDDAARDMGTDAVAGKGEGGKDGMFGSE